MHQTSYKPESKPSLSFIIHPLKIQAHFHFISMFPFMTNIIFINWAFATSHWGLFTVYFFSKLKIFWCIQWSYSGCKFFKHFSFNIKSLQMIPLEWFEHFVCNSRHEWTFLFAKKIVSSKLVNSGRIIIYLDDVKILNIIEFKKQRAAAAMEDQHQNHQNQLRRKKRNRKRKRNQRRKRVHRLKELLLNRKKRIPNQAEKKKKRKKKRMPAKLLSQLHSR